MNTDLFYSSGFGQIPKSLLYPNQLLISVKSVVIRVQLISGLHPLVEEGLLTPEQLQTTLGEQKDSRPPAPPGVELRFKWNAALAQDPFGADTIYYGSQIVHRSRRRYLQPTEDAPRSVNDGGDENGLRGEDASSSVALVAVIVHRSS